MDPLDRRGITAFVITSGTLSSSHFGLGSVLLLVMMLIIGEAILGWWRPCRGSTFIFHGFFSPLALRCPQARAVQTL